MSRPFHFKKKLGVDFELGEKAKNLGKNPPSGVFL